MEKFINGIIDGQKFEEEFYQIWRLNRDKEYSSGGNNISISATGFKIISSNARTNASGGYYIFCAWAECPTKYATAIR